MNSIFDALHSRACSLLAAGSLVASLSGCYGSAPAAPPQVAVAVEPGVIIHVQSHQSEALEARDKKIFHCPQGHTTESAACLVTHTTERVPVTHYDATALYGKRALTLAELTVLVDPDGWHKNVLALNEARGACDAANVPRWVGSALAIGGLVALGVGAAISDRGTGKAVALGGVAGIGAGTVSYSLGYFAFGGNRCSEANEIAARMPSAHVTVVHDFERGSAMEAAADRFNATVIPLAPSPEEKKNEAPPKRPAASKRRKNGDKSS